MEAGRGIVAWQGLLKDRQQPHLAPSRRPRRRSHHPLAPSLRPRRRSHHLLAPSRRPRGRSQHKPPPHSRILAPSSIPAGDPNTRHRPTPMSSCICEGLSSCPCKFIHRAPRHSVWKDTQHVIPAKAGIQPCRPSATVPTLVIPAKAGIQSCRPSATVPTLVIPAKAGIQPCRPSATMPTSEVLPSRFRGFDTSQKGRRKQRPGTSGPREVVVITSHTAQPTRRHY
jgi:hypothetical protein